MNNDAVYAEGLLQKALAPATQPPAIRAFLAEETSLVRDLLPRGARVVDFGCGMGRHLIAMDDHLGPSVGFDYERKSIREAHNAGSAKRCRFVVGDATRAPFGTSFDSAICLTNTWGTMSEKRRVLAEMRRTAPGVGTRLVTVYAVTSVEARTEWYANMGYPVQEVREHEIIAEGGFSSEHFSESRLRSLLGDCTVHRIGAVAFVAEF